MEKIKRRLFRVDKHQQFVDLATEFFCQHKRGSIKGKGDVWFQTSQRKRVYVEVSFKNHYREETYDNVTYMVYVVEQMIITQIGKYVFPYPLVVYGINIPAPGGYVHEKSKLYRFLKDVQLMAKRIG